jgi:hypothetical protein
MGKLGVKVPLNFSLSPQPAARPEPTAKLGVKAPNSLAPALPTAKREPTTKLGVRAPNSPLPPAPKVGDKPTAFVPPSSAAAGRALKAQRETTAFMPSEVKRAEQLVNALSPEDAQRFQAATDKLMNTPSVARLVKKAAALLEKCQGDASKLSEAEKQGLEKTADQLIANPRVIEVIALVAPGMLEQQQTAPSAAMPARSYASRNVAEAPDTRPPESRVRDAKLGLLQGLGSLYLDHVARKTGSTAARVGSSLLGATSVYHSARSLFGR